MITWSFCYSALVSSWKFLNYISMKIIRFCWFFNLKSMDIFKLYFKKYQYVWYTLFNGMQLKSEIKYCLIYCDTHFTSNLQQRQHSCSVYHIWRIFLLIVKSIDLSKKIDFRPLVSKNSSVESSINDDVKRGIKSL